MLTKVILIPVNLLTQRNSIKMVKLNPELDALKIKYADNKDKYTDEQLALYKRFKYNPFMSTLPLIIQIVIVLGLVGVIYRPLSYVLNIGDSDLSILNGWLNDTISVNTP